MPASARLAHDADTGAIWSRFNQYTPLVSAPRREHIVFIMQAGALPSSGGAGALHQQRRKESRAMHERDCAIVVNPQVRSIASGDGAVLLHPVWAVIRVSTERDGDLERDRDDLPTSWSRGSRGWSAT
jgi:hypothetical protein